MARREQWTNEDGLVVEFGPVTSNATEAGDNHIKGKIKQIELRVDVDAGYPTVGEALTTKHIGLPANAYVASARYIAEVDFDNAVEFGTAQLDGTAIDQDGLVATGTTTAEGDGAQVGSVIDEVAYLVMTETTDAPTEGKGTLVVEYII